MSREVFDLYLKMSEPLTSQRWNRISEINHEIMTNELPELKDFQEEKSFYITNKGSEEVSIPLSYEKLAINALNAHVRVLEEKKITQNVDEKCYTIAELRDKAEEYEVDPSIRSHWPSDFVQWLRESEEK